MQTHRPIAIILLLLALLSGCGNLSKPFPEKERFGISCSPTSHDDALNVNQTGHAEVSSGTARPPTPVLPLRVERVRVASPFDGRTFVHRVGEDQYTFDYYSEFVTGPDQLLTACTVARLLQNADLPMTLAPQSSADAGYRLETNILHLYADDRVPSKPQASIAAHFLLLQDFKDGTRVAGQWTLTESEPLPAANPKDLAAGYGKAFGRILDRLTDELIAALQVQDKLN